MCTSTSMADPAAGVLPPVRWRGRLLADGGIADNTPVSHAVALGARRIYVLLTQNPGDLVRYALAMSANGFYGVLAEIETLGLNLLELRKLTLDRESPESAHHRSP